MNKIMLRQAAMGSGLCLRGGIFLTAITLLAGCAALRNAPRPQVLPEQIIKAQDESASAVIEKPPDLQNIKGEELQQYLQKKGVIFAKTDFRGLLETRYVKFLFEDQDDSSHKFQLHIGGHSGEQGLPWEEKTVKPGYFFVELPAGKYKISSVTIPVGSTMAMEDMDVSLEVLPNTVCYVGTLKMVGTKERIKLGGVPVIKPGFEFTVDVLDEREEGAATFRKNYPNYPHSVSIKLMQVN